jgi:hypothetical protein
VSDPLVRVSLPSVASTGDLSASCSHFRMHSMLNRESVRARLDSEGGLSFTEFSYQLFQSHDFACLARDHGCVAQVGGSDQWGNITAGVDHVRRTLGQVRRRLCSPLWCHPRARCHRQSCRVALLYTRRRCSERRRRCW